MTEDKTLNQVSDDEILKPKITIFGVGGAGGNAINNMIRSDLEGVEFIAANTDAQSLKNSLAEHKIQLGAKTTKGLGAGSFPDRGREAAEENIDEIKKFLEGNNMVFIAAGMGGGTGTGAAPVIAKLSKEKDILTVGVVTKPFHFEGKYRMETADKGIEELKKHVDTLIVIPNQNLFRIANENTTFESAFKMADDVLHAGVRGVTDLITMPGLVNLDFADIRTIMTKMGKAMMGTGEASGENRAIAACEAAISNPLLDDISIKGAKGVLVNMTGGPDMTLFEADMAVNAIKKEVDSNANIIFGSAFNKDMEGKIRISVVATGIDHDEELRSQDQKYQEPSRFEVSNQSESLKSVEQPASGSFFDTGVVLRPENEKIEEISDSFSSGKSFLKEPNENYGKEKNSDSDKKLSQVSFFDDEDEDQNENKINLDKLSQESEITEPKITEEQGGKSKSKKSKKNKKEGSGFNLFSFMNVKNKKVSEDDLEENLEENYENKSREKESLFLKDSIEEDQEKAQRKVNFLPSFSKENDSQNNSQSQLKSEESEEENDNSKSIIGNMNFGEDKKEKIKQKKDEFFRSTIFDDEDETELKIEDDDILNVPAFFRRKKK